MKMVTRFQTCKCRPCAIISQKENERLKPRVEQTRMILASSDCMGWLKAATLFARRLARTGSRLFRPQARAIPVQPLKADTLLSIIQAHRISHARPLSKWGPVRRFLPSTSLLSQSEPSEFAAAFSTPFLASQRKTVSFSLCVATPTCRVGIIGRGRRNATMVPSNSVTSLRGRIAWP